MKKEGLKMARKKGFGVSPITNKIFYGTQDTDKGMWVGTKNRCDRRCYFFGF
jgi:hypothetical protein